MRPNAGAIQSSRYQPENTRMSWPAPVSAAFRSAVMAVALEERQKTGTNRGERGSQNRHWRRTKVPEMFQKPVW
jgi:hypothetical protein